MHGSARPLTPADDGDGPPTCPVGSDVQDAPVCLDRLYREQSPRLLRSLVRRTSDREEARDLVHEIFCRIARLGAEGTLHLQRPQAYLGRMATNLLRDRAKRGERHMPGNHVPADEEVLAGPDQQRLLESRDMLARIEAAMLRLRPKTREIFVAHRIEGLSYAEIAERTGLSVKGVEKQMSKAIASIDRILDRD